MCRLFFFLSIANREKLWYIEAIIRKGESLCGFLENDGLRSRWLCF